MTLFCAMVLFLVASRLLSTSARKSLAWKAWIFAGDQPPTEIERPVDSVGGAPRHWPIGGRVTSAPSRAPRADWPSPRCAVPHRAAPHHAAPYGSHNERERRSEWTPVGLNVRGRKRDNVDVGNPVDPRDFLSILSPRSSFGLSRHPVLYLAWTWSVNRERCGVHAARAWRDPTACEHGGRAEGALRRAQHAEWRAHLELRRWRQRRQQPWVRRTRLIRGQFRLTAAAAAAQAVRCDGLQR